MQHCDSTCTWCAQHFFRWWKQQAKGRGDQNNRVGRSGPGSFDAEAVFSRLKPKSGGFVLTPAYFAAIVFCFALFTFGVNNAHADNRVLPAETWISVPDVTKLHPGEEQTFILDEVHFLVTRAQLESSNATALALQRCVLKLEGMRTDALTREVETIDIPWPKWKWASVGAGFATAFVGGVWLGTSL